MESYVGKTCPYCHFPIKLAQQVTVCEACDQPHHTECWHENQGCTTYGCRSQGTAAPLPVAVLPSGPTAAVRAVPSSDRRWVFARWALVAVSAAAVCAGGVAAWRWHATSSRDEAAGTPAASAPIAGGGPARGAPAPGPKAFAYPGAKVTLDGGAEMGADVDIPILSLTTSDSATDVVQFYKDRWGDGAVTVDGPGGSATVTIEDRVNIAVIDIQTTGDETSINIIFVPAGAVARALAEEARKSE
jgi:hypothetical protein